MNLYTVIVGAAKHMVLYSELTEKTFYFRN